MKMTWKPNARRKRQAAEEAAEEAKIGKLLAALDPLVQGQVDSGKALGQAAASGDHQRVKGVRDAIELRATAIAAIERQVDRSRRRQEALATQRQGQGMFWTTVVLAAATLGLVVATVGLIVATLAA